MKKKQDTKLLQFGTEKTKMIGAIVQWCDYEVWW